MMSTPNRRDFLAATVGSAAAFASQSIAQPPTPVATADAVIFFTMTGGPSQLDTFDPKPNGPSDVRGPYRPISTRIPGMQISELFPHLADVTDRIALVRTVYHDAPPVHEAGLQLLHTGRVFRENVDMPNLGATYTALRPAPKYNPFDWVCMPYEKLQCGINIGTGLNESWLRDKNPMRWYPDTDVAAFNDVCEEAFDYRMQGTRFLSINQYPSVFDMPTWDCHAASGSLSCNLKDYQQTVAPSFDLYFSQLLISLQERGLLERTLVVATGEFGRTPKLNSNGGRDHWAGCWTTLFAGGGVQGGHVIGESDAIASEPKTQPVHARDIAATVLHSLGIAAHEFIPESNTLAYEGKPIRELF